MISLSSLTLNLSPKGTTQSAPPPTGTITIDDFSRDRTLFDSGVAFGRSSAGVPVSGQGTDGQIVQARALTIGDGGAGATNWTDIATIDTQGNWAGTIDAPLNTLWYRAEVRLKAIPAVTAQSGNRFGVGHVIAVWGQSEVERIYSTFYNNTPAPAVIDDDALQVFIGASGNPARSFVTNTAPITSALAAMAATFIAERPGEKFAVVFQSVAGTDPRELVSDANPGRSWANDKALHDLATADGQSVGLAAMSWFASPGSLGDYYGPAMFPLFAGKQTDGTPVTFPAVIADGLTSTFQADHWFGELYDYAHTKWVPYGPQRFDIDADMQDATHYVGGAVQFSFVNKQRSRESWRQMLALPDATMFLPLALEPINYVNGYDDGAGGWADYSHPAGNTADGVQAWARLTAHAVMRSAGLTNWVPPIFDNAYWEPGGAYVEIWSSAGPVTTTRLARGEPALGTTYPHWTNVMGIQINASPAKNTSIVAGRVRILPNAGTFVQSDVLQFGEGAASGALKFPEDYFAETWKNLPIVNVGVAGIDGIAVRTLASPSVLANTLVSGPPQFTVSASAGPWFYDPANIGTIGQLTAVFEGALNTPASSEFLLVPTGANVTLTLLNSRVLRVFLKDSGNTTLVPTTLLPNAVPTGPVRIVLSVDLAAGYLRVWMDGVQQGDFSFGANSGALAASVRRISVLAANNGSSQLGGSFARIAIWKSATATGADPATTPYHQIVGPASAANADTWKQGANAT
jgi:hypothetical protein